MSNFNPLVSIIIPLYNAERYIANTIQSALAQTWINKEIIIINDGSTDTSLAIAQQFESEIVKVLSQENKGASAARNYGLREAKGDYIQFLDADDLLKPDKISVQLKQLANKQDTLSACPIIHFDDGQTDLTLLKPNDYELSFYKDSQDPFEFLLKLYGADDNQGSMVPVHSWLSPVALLNKAGNWDESLSINDDGEFFCRVILQAKEIVVTNQTICYYRKYTGKLSLSSNQNQASLTSQYAAILLRKAHLKNHKQDIRINQVINKGLMELLIITYPGYKNLSAKIAAELQQSGAPVYVPPIGGKVLETIKSFFGWKAARTLQYYYTKVFKKSVLNK